jgi:hypothetical protein
VDLIEENFTVNILFIELKRCNSITSNTITAFHLYDMNEQCSSISSYLFRLLSLLRPLLAKGLNLVLAARHGPWPREELGELEELIEENFTVNI